MPFLKVKTNDAWVPVGWTERVVDDALSTTSTNPVQNKIVSSAVTVLAEAINNKADENHTHNIATSDTAGFMSAEDKIKLDGLGTESSNITVDSAFSTESTNPVQNKLVTAALVELHTITTEQSEKIAKLGAAEKDGTLSISLNGTSTTTFDGTSNVAVNVTPSSIGAVTMDCSSVSGTTSANKIIVSESEPTVENGAIWVNPTSVIDTGWQEVVLNTTDFKAYGDLAANAPRYRRVGDMVQIKGIISPVNDTNSIGSATATEIGTIPVDCAPSTAIIYTVCHGSGNAVWLLDITLEGTIRASRYALGETSTTPKADYWMPFSVTYLI